MATIVRCDFCKQEVKAEDRRLWQFGEPIEGYPPYTYYFDLCPTCLTSVKHEVQQMLVYLQCKKEQGE